MKVNLRFLAIIPILLLVSCGSEEEISNPNRFATISTEKTALNEAELAIIKVENYSLEQETYNAK